MKAFHFAKDSIGKESKVGFYLELHKKACSHFQGNANNTQMLSSEAGHFRNEKRDSVSSKFPVGLMLAILNDPYVSTIAPLTDWVGYLKEGMKKWQEAAKVSAVFNQSI